MRRGALLLGLFFASGASGLVYQVVWMRLLTLSLSVTVYAVATVLCAFMAGLGLGAALGGWLADRLRRPLVAYGVAELGIAGAALATTAILGHLAPAYVWLHHQLGGSGTAFGVARFLLVFGILLVPCVLMGTTLPLLSRAAIGELGRVGRGTGALYGVNTLGAVIGCFAAGFVLVPAFGLRATTVAAAALNVAIGALALAAGWAAASPPPGRQAARVPARAGLVCLAFAVSGFTAMGYEVLWTRALEPFTHNSTYAYSAMLATFLLGLGAGSVVAAPLADRVRRPLWALALVEVAIGLSVAVALVVYARFNTLVPAVAGALGGLTSWSRVMLLIFSEAGVVLLATTLLFGATFPLVARLVVDALDTLGGRIAGAYAANTAGSIVGAVAVGFLILPALGMRGAFLTLVFTNLALGAALAVAVSRRAGMLAGAGAVAAAVVISVVVPVRLFEQSFATRFGQLLFYREEVTDTVMVTEDQKGARWIRFGDGRGTAGTITVREDRLYGHLPLLLHPAPRRVLSICFGVGNSLAALLTHPVEQVDAVELSPGVIAAAPFFRATNRDALTDPRVHLTIEDGRNFLLASRERYDVIRLDPPELHTAGVVNLYTREFYELARAHLAPGGIFSIWVNIVMTPEEDLRLLVRTLADVFPHVSVWHGPYRYSWVLNGSLEPRPPDLRVIVDRLAEPSVGTDLASIGIPDAFSLLTHFVFADRAAAAFAGQGPLVTDDHTRLDFSVPRSLDSFYGIANANTDHWLVQLMEPTPGHDVALGIFFRKVSRMNTYKQPVLPYLVNVEAAGLDREEVRVRLKTEAAASHPRPGPGASGRSPAHASRVRIASAAARWPARLGCQASRKSGSEPDAWRKAGSRSTVTHPASRPRVTSRSWRAPGARPSTTA